MTPGHRRSPSVSQLGPAVVLAAAMLIISLPAQSVPSVTYTYDQSGRLKTATYKNGTTIIYSYDKAGNRTAVVVTKDH